MVLNRENPQLQFNLALTGFIAGELGNINKVAKAFDISTLLKVKNIAFCLDISRVNFLRVFFTNVIDNHCKIRS